MMDESNSRPRYESLDLFGTDDGEISQVEVKSRPIDILLLSVAGIFLVLGVTNIVITAGAESTIAVREGSGLATIAWIIICLLYTSDADDEG